MGLTPVMALMRRELIASLRLTRSFIILALILLGCAGAVLAVWPTGFLDFRAAPDTANNLLFVVCMVLLCGAGLFVPALAASAVVGEREQGTIDLLRGTLIRPMLLVFTKWLDAMGLFALIVVGVAPILGVVIYGIGFDWERALSGFLAIGIAAGLAAAIGMAGSSLARRSSLAIYVSYMTVALVTALPAVIAKIILLLLDYFLCVNNPYFYPVFYGDFLPILCPPYALIALVADYLPTPFYLMWQWWTGVAYYLFLIIAALAVARWSLFRERRLSAAETERPLDDLAMLRQRRARFPYFLIDPLRRKGPIADGANPMRVKELRWGIVSRGSSLVRLFYLSFAACLFTAIIIAYDVHSQASGAVTWLVVEMGTLCLVAPALLANTFPKERELGNLDMLRLTMLAPREIVSGKILSGAVSLAPVLLGATCAGLVALCLTWQQMEIVLVGHVTLFVVAFLSLGLGLLVSAYSRRTAAALVTAYFAAMLLFIGNMFVGLFLSEIWYSGQAIETKIKVQNAINLLSPIWAFVNFAVEPEQRMQSLASLAVYVLLGAIMLWAAVVGYSRRYHVD